MPFSDEELAEAAALREALEQGEDPLAMELRGAYAPASLADADLDALVSRALGDESAATNAERAAAEQLRADLAGEAFRAGGSPHAPAPALGEGGELALALKLAAHPRALPQARNDALVDAALRAPLSRRGPLSGPLGRRRSALRRIAPVTMAALTGVAALAAGVALFLGRAPLPEPALGGAAAMVHTRSADELFDAATPFPRHGGESARVDRIASARASDLRNNRYAAWGVR
jgi:hypothetical protein